MVDVSPVFPAPAARTPHLGAPMYSTDIPHGFKVIDPLNYVPNLKNWVSLLHRSLVLTLVH